MTGLDLDKILIGFVVAADESFGSVAKKLNQAGIPPTFGRKWTEAAVAGEIGRLIAAGKLEERGAA